MDTDSVRRARADILPPDALNKTVWLAFRRATSDQDQPDAPDIFVSAHATREGSLEACWPANDPRFVREERLHA